MGNPYRSPCVLLMAAAIAAASTDCRNRGDDGEIVATGHVEATDVRVPAKTGGTLLELHPQEGDRVEAGQLVALLDTVDARLALDSAEAERAAAEAELRLRLAGSRTEEIAEAAALVDQAGAELEGAQRELARMEGLLATGSGTARGRDDALARRDASGARLRAARQRLARLQAGSRPQEIDAARARLEAAEARIAQLRRQIEDATVASPLAGVVTERLAEPGEILAPGAPLVVVTDLPNAWLTAYIAETDLGRIRLGQEARVITDDGQERPGRVRFIASRAEFTPRNVQTRDERVKLVYRIKIGLDNAGGLFKPGMPAEARLRPGPPGP